MRYSLLRSVFTTALVAVCGLGSHSAIAGPVDHDLEDYVLYAGRNISFRERSNITGHIGAGRDVSFREDSKIFGSVYVGRSSTSRERVQFGGDFLVGRDIDFRYDCIIDGTVEAGRRASLNLRTHVKGDLTAGDSITLQSGAVVDGTQSPFTTPSMNWVQETVVFPSFTPGANNLDLAARQTHEIDPGSYRDLYVREYATVKLRSGVYHFRNISMREYLTWEFDDTNGPVVVHVSENMASREGTSFTTTSGDSSGLTLWIGRDLSFRESNKFVGQIRAVRGVSFRERFEMTGTVYALRDISVREDSNFKNSTPPPIFYVRKQGSDSNDGRSPGTAFRTIQRGVNSCTVAGSVVYVGPGVYQESIEIGTGVGVDAVSGTESKPIRLVGDMLGAYTNDSPGAVVLDGRSSNPNGFYFVSRLHWSIDGFEIANQQNYAIRATNSGLDILNCTIDVPASYGMYVTAMGDVQVSDCVFERDSDSLHSVWIQPINQTEPTSVTVTRNDLTLKGGAYHNSGFEAGWSWGSGVKYSYGIIVYGWNSPNGLLVEISNNQISDSYLPIYSGVYNSPNSSSLIANNTIVSSFYGLYSYMNNGGSSTIVNNIIDTTYYGLLAYGFRSDVPVVENLLETGITYSMTRYNRPFELDIITGSPVYVDAPAGDFSLAGGSPGVDAGNNRYSPAVDFLGASRPTDGDGDGVAVVDLGAYETVNAPTRVRVVRWREIGAEHNR